MPIFNSHAKNFFGVAEPAGGVYEGETEWSRQEIKEIVLNVVKNVVDSANRQKNDAAIRNQPDEKRMIKKAAYNYLKQSGLVQDDEQRQFIMGELEKYLWGYYVLDDLVNDSDISDIRVLQWNYVRYKKTGKRYRSNVHFLDENDYLQFINMLAMRNRKNLSDINAICYFTDTSNEHFILRFNICTQLISSDGIPVLTIRKVPKEKYSMEQLIAKGMLDQRMSQYLKEKAIHSSGILFTGKGASGKTTLLNTLLEHIDERKSALVIQESDELFISRTLDENGYEVPRRDITFLHTISYNGDGKMEYNLSDLVRNGLLMDLDYYVIGEIKGNEAEGFSMASYTGHQCWATVHGMNSFEGINKLADYIKQATNYEFEDCLKKLIGMEVIIFMKDFKVCEVTEIKGFDYQKHDLIKQVIYRDGCWLDE